MCIEDLTDDEIVRQAVEDKESACLSDDEDEPCDAEPRPTSKEAAASILRRFFEGDDSKSAELVNQLEDRILKCVTLKQAKIMGYLTKD